MAVTVSTLQPLLSAYSTVLSFYLNGTPINLKSDDVDPNATLLDFLRSQKIGLTGTKLGCGEGGCGACTVVVQSLARDGQIQHLAVNACLAPLISVAHKHVITVEGLGNSENPHPIQERLWRGHGSQCGFCTSGIVMSIYALLRNAKARGELTIDQVEMEGVLDGNLCRCTGYKPILDMVKTFCGSYTPPATNGVNGTNGAAADAEKSFVVPINYAAANLRLDDPLSNGTAQCRTDKPLANEPTAPVGTNAPIDPLTNPTGRTSATNGDSDAATSRLDDATVKASLEKAKPNKGCGRADCCQLAGNGAVKKTGTAGPPSKTFADFQLRPYRPGTELIFPPRLRKLARSSIAVGKEGDKIWLAPSTLDELLEAKDALGTTAKVVGGSSEVQVEVKFKAANFPINLFISDIPELSYIVPLTKESAVFAFGGNTPLSELEVFCKEAAKGADVARASIFGAIAGQLRYFAGMQIRNVASVAGNIATASPISDLNPVWVALGAEVLLVSKDGERTVNMKEFFLGYRKTAMGEKEVIKEVRVPLPAAGEVTLVRAYKQAKRKDDDIAIVNACFAITLDAERNIKSASLSYGGMAPTTILARKTQDALVGKPFNYATLNATLDVLGAEVDLAFDVPGGMASFRKTLALSFFFKYWHDLALSYSIQLDSEFVTKEHLEDIVSSIHRQPSTGMRDNEDMYAQRVLGTQEPHPSGLKHTTGEAIYVDDMPKIGNELYGALVISDKAHAKLLSVDASAALEVEGVHSWVDHTDLPTPEANFWGAAARDEVFFAVDEVRTHGQPIGMIVAESKFIAQKAARLVKVEYEDLPMILTIEEAIAAGSFHPQYDRWLKKGKPIEEAFAESEIVLEGHTRMGGQEHFYLETMACLAIPKLESGEMEVVSSTQALTDAQRWAAQVTGVPRNRIVAKVKRLGGGFGGKETRAGQLNAVCAVAAKKTRRAVRCMLDRDVDIATSGQRHPYLADWKVGFTKEGRIQALDIDMFNNAGWTLDISGGVNDRALTHADNVYEIPNAQFRARCAKTNTVSNTAFRGFGGPQGMVIAEHYIDRIAHHLGKEPDEIRAINMYKEGDRTPFLQELKDFYIPRMVKELKEESDYEARKKAVDEYNSKHRFRKRGIVCLPTKYGLSFGVRAMNQGCALVHIYMDGSVLVAHGGTEMGQGLNLKCLQIAAQELDVPLDAVFTSESATNTVPNAPPTAGSAGSDLHGHATALACRELMQRLAPFREQLGKDAPLSALCAAAWNARVSLSATGYYVTPEIDYEWHNFVNPGPLFYYFTQGVAISEVEVDTLTGDHTVRRVDIKMDVGRSLNPAIDYGQIEGAFLQGQGWSTMEESLWTRFNGKQFTLGPGNLKIPGFADIPQVFNVSLLKNVEWAKLHSIGKSKGIGEPPLFLGASVALAIRQAVKSARQDAGIAEIQELRFPLTSERIRMAAGDHLAKKGKAEPKEGQRDFFVHI